MTAPREPKTAAGMKGRSLGYLLAAARLLAASRRAEMREIAAELQDEAQQLRYAAAILAGELPRQARRRPAFSA